MISMKLKVFIGYIFLDKKTPQKYRVFPKN